MGPFLSDPSGNKDTNFTGVVGTTFYMMPVGVGGSLLCIQCI